MRISVLVPKYLCAFCAYLYGTEDFNLFLVGSMGMFEVRISEEEGGPWKSNCYLMAELGTVKRLATLFLLPAMQGFCN